MIIIPFALSGFVMIVMSYAGKVHWSDGILFLRFCSQGSLPSYLVCRNCVLFCMEGEFELIIQKIYLSIKDNNN